MEILYLPHGVPRRGVLDRHRRAILEHGIIVDLSLKRNATQQNRGMLRDKTSGHGRMMGNYGT